LVGELSVAPAGYIVVKFSLRGIQDPISRYDSKEGKYADHPQRGVLGADVP
jgi:hypothetical protein